MLYFKNKKEKEKIVLLYVSKISKKVNYITENPKPSLKLTCYIVKISPV